MSDVDLRGSGPRLKLYDSPQSHVDGSQPQENVDVDVAPIEIIKPPSTVHRKPKRTEKQPLDRRTVARTKPPPGLVRHARYGALTDHVRFRERAGRPKDDISFGFLGTWRMSTGYKSILEKLEDYHSSYRPDVLATIHDPNQDYELGESDSEKVALMRTLQSMREDLDDLTHCTDRYIRKSGHTRKDEVMALRAEIAHERRVINRLYNEIAASKGLPLMSLKQMVAYARQGLSLGAMRILGSEDLPAEQARAQIDQRTLRNIDYQKYLKNGFNEDEALLLERSGLGLEGGQLYRDLDLAITPETIVKDFRYDTSLGDLRPIGTAGISSVALVRYDRVESHYKGVFKWLRNPDPTRQRPIEAGQAAKRMGIDRYNPQTAMRNLATCGVARLLGFDVVAKTEVGLHQTPGGKKVLGLVMEEAPGRMAMDRHWRVFDMPDVRREITRLQWLDHLCAQGDRHRCNYFIGMVNGEVKVTGIDNDQCFGQNIHDPNGIARGREPENKYYRGTLMPPVIDTEMAKAFEDLTEDALVEELTGKLTEEEIEAAVMRLRGIKDYIVELRNNDMVIEPDEWGSEKVDLALNSSNSYAIRDRNIIGRGGRSH